MRTGQRSSPVIEAGVNNQTDSISSDSVSVELLIFLLLEDIFQESQIQLNLQEGKFTSLSPSKETQHCKILFLPFLSHASISLSLSFPSAAFLYAGNHLAAASQLPGPPSDRSDNLKMEAKYFRFLKLVGTGFKARAEAGGRLLYLKLGYSHEVELTVPPAVRVFCFKTDNRIVCAGIDKERTHQFAATVRSCKPPEVYKGKGIRYADEVIKLKPGKKGKMKK